MKSTLQVQDFKMTILTVQLHKNNCVYFSYPYCVSSVSHALNSSLTLSVFFQLSLFYELSQHGKDRESMVFHPPPDNGDIDSQNPSSSSPLRLESFSEFVETAYVNRYKGLPPHVV